MPWFINFSLFLIYFQWNTIFKPYFVIFSPHKSLIWVIWGIPILKANIWRWLFCVVWIVHCGSLRQTAQIQSMSQDCLRTGDKALVHFKFIKHPEYIKPGVRLVTIIGSTISMFSIIFFFFFFQYFFDRYFEKVGLRLLAMSCARFLIRLRHS